MRGSPTIAPSRAAHGHMLASASGPLCQHRATWALLATSGCREVASQPPSCGKSARTPCTPRSAVTPAPSSWPSDCVSAPGEGCFAVFPLYVPVCVSFSEGRRFRTTGQWLEAGNRRRTGHPLPRRPEPHSCCSACPVASFKGKLVSPGVGRSLGPPVSSSLSQTSPF